MKELRVTPIKNGTVIDHIACGAAMQVLKIIGVSDKKVNSPVSVLMHVPSKRAKWKDIVKVEDRELNPQEMNKIALVAPNATINIIRNSKVVKKYIVELPPEIRGIVRCENPNCISNQKEPVESRFKVVSKNPPSLRCHYCEREVENIVSNIL